MIAKHEVREYDNDAKVYIAKYKNLNNILHWHYDCEIIYALQGKLNVYSYGASYVLNEGQAMFIGNMEEHAIRTIEQSESLIFIFSYDIIKSSIKNQQLFTPALKQGYDLVWLYESIKNELILKQKYYEKKIENSISTTIIDIFRVENVVKSELKKKDKMSFMQLINDIDEKYAYYTSEDAANFLHFSKIYFSKYFKIMTGTNFIDYLNSVKISKAVGLLQSGKDYTISQIASLCGYNTIRNFNRVFKQITGMQPQEITGQYIFEDTIFFSSGQNKEFDPTLRHAILLESHGKNI